jgi:hypothetical protein
MAVSSGIHDFVVGLEVAHLAAVLQDPEPDPVAFLGDAGLNSSTLEL